MLKETEDKNVNKTNDIILYFRNLGKSLKIGDTSAAIYRYCEMNINLKLLLVGRQKEDENIC